jgi:hypothetical protein
MAALGDGLGRAGRKGERDPAGGRRRGLGGEGERRPGTGTGTALTNGGGGGELSIPSPAMAQTGETRKMGRVGEMRVWGHLSVAVFS